MEREYTYSWHQEPASDSRSGTRLLLRAAILGLLLAAPNFVGAAFAVSAGFHAVETVAWITGLSTGLLALPWILPLALIGEMVVGKAPFWLQLLGMGILEAAAFTFNASFALRKVRLRTLMLIFVPIVLIQCALVISWI